MWRARAAEQARRTRDGATGRLGEGRDGGLGRSEIDCLAGVQEVGNRLTILIPTLIVWLLIVLKATWLCFCSKREVG